MQTVIAKSKNHQTIERELDRALGVVIFGGREDNGRCENNFLVRRIIEKQV
jgi:hypothetical protein